ncbi:unnamed protein product [Rotaria magnacalcarata]|nr:unnamed protein product [Rotaria magnacalcarata]
MDVDTNSPVTAATEVQSNGQSASTSADTAPSSSSSAQTTITGRKSSSEVWLYATKSDDGQLATCKLCNYTCTSSSHSTSTIRYHLIRKHKKHNFLLNTTASSSTNKIKISEHLKKELHELCYNAVITDSRTFNDFRKEGMLAIFDRLMPGYTPPHRNQIASKLKILNNYHHKLLKQELQEVEQLGLTFDFWTSRCSISFLCITGHWFQDDFTYISKIIDFSYFNERHTGINISSLLTNRLTALNINDKVVSITCDGAENMSSACRTLDENIHKIWCCAHRLHLVITNGLGFWFKENKNKNNNEASSSSTTMTTTRITTADVTPISNDGFFNTNWPDELNEDGSEAAADMHGSTTNDEDEENSSSEDLEELNHSIENEDFDQTEDHSLIDDNWSMDVEDHINPIEVLVLIINLLKKCRAIATTIKRSTIISEFFRKEQALLKINKTITIDCKTRWNSTFFLIDSMIRCKAILLKLFNEKHSLSLRREHIDKLTTIELLTENWNTVSSLRLVLNPFYLATTMLSGKNYPSVGLAFHAIQKLKHFCSKEDTYQDEIKQCKKLLLVKINHYFFNDLEQVEHLQYHSYFDPAAHLSLTEIEKQQNERHIKYLILNDVYPRKSSTTDVTRTASSSITLSTSSTRVNDQSNQSVSNNDSKSSTYGDFIAACGNDGQILGESNKEKSKRISLHEEFKYFKTAVQEFNLKNEPSTTSATRFWQMHYTKLPILSHLAKIHLSAPGTSVPSESAFSTSAYTARKERARLSPENLSYSVFLKDKIVRKK